MVIFTRTQIVARAFTSAAIFLLLLTTAHAQAPGPLERYVVEPDPSYSFNVVRSEPGTGYTAHVLQMTSQTWRSATEVNLPAWRHWVRIVVPTRLSTSTGFLFINGGSNQDPAPPTAGAEIAQLATLAGAVAAEILTVPNQPLTFSDRPTPLSEDALVAYTWDKFLRTGDERWPVQLPMTKAVVRAMDTITAFTRTTQGGGVTVDRFILAGGSKRGWPAWLTAAVDTRVAAIIPLVIDLLNTEESFIHHWQMYGFWASAVRDYEQAGIFTWLRTPQIAALRSITDPYLYRSRLTMPKYIINSAGDEFFAPDSAQFYFDDLPGQKYLRYVPNTSHEIDNPDVLAGGLAFFQFVSSGRALPRFSWELPAEGGIRLRATDRPVEVRLWQATNPNARDFRVQTIGKTWTSTVVSESSPGVYEARLTPPPQGWSAYLLEVTYSTGGLFSVPMKFTTPVRIVPDVLPFAAPLITVSAANYLPLTSADSLVSGYGQDLSTTTESATQVPLPTTLGGTSVRVTDSAGVERAAQLIYVNPTQVNYLIPAGTATGIAQVDVVRQGDVVVRGETLVENAAPALFSADASGRGVAAGVAVLARADGSQQATILSRGAPVSLGAAGDQVYLSLFGTAMRNAGGAATATVGGEPVTVFGPVPQSEFAGLDQVNVGPLPRSLAGRGEVNIALVAGGKAANIVTVIIQ
jgi:uncharacterized protein (TIGR03437 family)